MTAVDYARGLRRLFALLEVAQLRHDRAAELIVIGRIRAFRAAAA